MCIHPRLGFMTLYCSNVCAVLYPWQTMFAPSNIVTSAGWLTRRCKFSHELTRLADKIGLNFQPER